MPDDVHLAGETGLTAETGPGPYYISDAPLLEDGDLNYARLPGEKIRISGHVYGGEGTSRPVPRAKVEVWHADAQGRYHPPAPGNMSMLDPGVVALRGHVIADGGGAYGFSTIYPGFYRGRTRHLHVRVSAEGYRPLVTQMVVAPRPGDGVTPETDPLAQSLPPASHVRFSEEDGGLVGTFDFHLALG